MSAAVAAASSSAGADSGRAAISLQKRFSDQRARLLALEYHDPFTTESLALVERLFNDLVTTTESYEDLQQREEQTANELALNRAQLFPLKKESARLTRDNNLLHLKVIKATEEASAAERSALLLEKKAQADQEENRYLGAQKDEQIAELEKQIEELRTGLTDALRDGSGGGRVLGKRGFAGKALNGFERREMEVSGPPPAGNEASSRRTRAQARGVSNFKGMGYEEDPLSKVVETLRERLEEASASLAGMEEERVTLEKQVEAREKEIARLGRQLGNDSTLEKVTLAHAHEANRRIVEQLNDQVDFLNRQLAVREEQLSKTREDYDKRKTGQIAAELEAKRLQDRARELEAHNTRLIDEVEELQKDATSVLGATQREEETEGGGGGENARWLQESLAEAKNRVAEAEAEAADAKVEAENLRRRFGVAGDGSAAEAATGARRAGEVEEADLAAMEEKDRSQADLQRAREEGYALRSEIARLRVEAVSAAEELQRSTRERDDLLDKLQASSAAVARGEDGETGDAGGRWGEEEKKEALRRRATSERLSLAEGHAEFMAGEAEVARREQGAANQRAALAEARAEGAERQSMGLERALRAETRRALGAEGEAASARSEGGNDAVIRVEDAERRVEEFKARLEASESARDTLREELERLAGQGSLLGAERFAQANRMDALERERENMRQDLGARERDVAELQEQKRALEAEASRARRALSRGALETVSMARGELELQARVEEAADEARRLKADVSRLTDKLLKEEEKASEAREEADRLAARLSHRGAGLEGLEAEVASLRAALSVARSEAAEREGLCARMEAEADRARQSVVALERRASASRDAASEKDGEIARLKALARQLEGSRETLKASEEQARAALRDAELRAGRVAAVGDGAKRDAEAAREEAEKLRRSLAELDADRDRLQDALDGQSEALAAVRGGEDRWRQRLAKAEERLREEGSRGSDLEQALESAERRAAKAERSATEELRKAEALASAVEGKTRQLAAATEDLEAMAKENQAVTAELNRLGQERDEGRRGLGNALHRQATSERAARAAQFEKEDVLKNYRGLHAEKTRLEGAVDELQLARSRLTKSLAERDAEVSRLRASVTALEMELRRKTADLGAAQRQAENLSAQLLRGGRQVEALVAENRRLVASARAQRHHANSMLERIRSQQGHSLNAEQEVNSLRARLQALEEERDGLSHILGRERSHGTGLEQLIEASRLREASVAAEQRRLAREKDRLETKAKRLTEELAQARDCLADLSSRASGSSRRDESSPYSGNLQTPASSNAMKTPSPPGASSSSSGVRASPTPTAQRVRHREQQQQRHPRVDRADDFGGASPIAEGRGEARPFSDLGGSWRDRGSPGEEEEKGVDTSAVFSPLTRQQQQSPSTAALRAAAAPEAERRRARTAFEPGGSGGGRGRGEAFLVVGRGDPLLQRQQGEGEDEDSGVFDLEDMRGFLRRESQRLRDSVRAGRAGGGSGGSQS